MANYVISTASTTTSMGLSGNKSLFLGNKWLLLRNKSLLSGNKKLFSTLVLIPHFYVTLLTLLPPRGGIIYLVLGVRRGRRVSCFLSFSTIAREKSEIRF